MNSKSDFHMHTTHSDGALTVDEIIYLLRDLGVEYFSITDHDSVGANFELEKLARINRNWPKSITGIEISTHYHNKVLHLLAYGFKPDNRDLTQFLNEQKEARRNRAIAIIELLNQNLVRDGKKIIPIDEILKLETEGPITRPDIAKYLIQHGYVQSFQEAFDRWLRRCDVPLVTGDITDAIGLIRDIGGVPVLAHAFAPHVSLEAITKDTSKQVQILTELKQAGLQGLEIYYSDYETDPNSQVSPHIEKADGLGILVTGGSDFHGGGRTTIVLPGVSYPKHRVDRFLNEVHK